MRKKLYCLLLAAICLAVLSGCCLSHEWVEADCITAKTCSKCGKTEGEALGHTWTDATCEAPKICSKCGETEGEPLGHSWVDATCTAPMTCTTCAATEGDVQHKPQRGYDTSIAKVNGAYFYEGQCADCGEWVKNMEIKPYSFAVEIATGHYDHAYRVSPDAWEELGPGVTLDLAENGQLTLTWGEDVFHGTWELNGVQPNLEWLSYFLRIDGLGVKYAVFEFDNLKFLQLPLWSDEAMLVFV